MNITPLEHVRHKAQRARGAATALRTLSSSVKDAALLAIATALIENRADILAANELDVTAGRQRGLSEAMLDRLRLNDKRLAEMAAGCRQVAALPDPIGTVIDGQTRPNGLRIERIRVPLGVIGIIYESRPNVTVDAAILCLKSGNAAVLRGGSEAIHTNLALADIVNRAARQAGVPDGAIELIEITDREATSHLAQMSGLIDLIVPRGGPGLKQALMEVATVPIIYAAGGVCHVFLDATADLKMASDIVFNAKVQKPSACNAAETVLVHRGIAAQFLPALADRLVTAGVELRGDAATLAIVPGIKAAVDGDWDTEHLNLTLGVCVVDDLDAAIAHIALHGTGHSEAIVTADYANGQRFCGEIDAAAVFINASTRFTDGYEFGLGAEIGISTQKLHARGPMGLEALTSTQYLVRGNGQIRA